MIKTYYRETKLYEFSRDTNREELMTRKNNVTLQWLHFGVICLERIQNFLKNYDFLPPNMHTCVLLNERSLCNGTTLKWHGVTLQCSF